MTLLLLQLPLYLWIVLGLVAVAVIVLFGMACVRIIKRSDREKTDKVAFFLLLMLSSVTAQAMEGDGSYFSPYRIASINDWNSVATAVNNGLNTYYQKCFRLEADITVNVSNGDKMMGTEDHAFRGYFDGVGHTLTFEYQNGMGDYVAPFRHASYTRIERLRVEGTLHTTGQFAGGLVGKADSVAVNCCRVSTNMILDHSDHSGDASSGGIIGKAVNPFIIQDTRFDGVLCMSQNSTTHSCGGFVGWVSTDSWLIDRCLYAPKETLPATRVALGTTGCATFARYSGMDDTNWHDHIRWYNPCTHDDCWTSTCLYTRTLGQAQGVDMSTLTSNEILRNFGIGSDYDKKWELNSSLQPVPSMRGFDLSYGSISGVEESYSVGARQDVRIVVSVYDDSGHKLVLGEEFTLKLDGAVMNTEELFIPAPESLEAVSHTITVLGLNSGSYTGSVAKTFTVSRVGDISLPADANNNVVLGLYDELALSSVTLNGRTFYKDNKWSTLCLPFDLASLNGTPLEGADIRTLNNAEYNSSTGTLTLNFTIQGAITAIQAGKPYIIRWASGDAIESPIFCGVTIHNALVPVVVDDVVSFRGTYGSNTFGQADASILFMGNDNTLYYPLQGAIIYAQHAYFQLLGDLTAGTPADPTHAPLHIVMNIDEPQSGTNIPAVQKVDLAQKYIKDGRLYIIKDGVVYDVLGKLVR